MLAFYARHKLCLHHAGDLMVALRPFPEERVDLVYEHDARLRLPSEREERGHELVRLAVPLVCEHRRRDVDERRARLFCQRLREHGLAAPWWAEEQDTLSAFHVQSLHPFRELQGVSHASFF